jgi:hypothetical protein
VKHAVDSGAKTEVSHLVATRGLRGQPVWAIHHRHCPGQRQAWLGSDLIACHALQPDEAGLGIDILVARYHGASAAQDARLAALVDGG